MGPTASGKTGLAVELVKHLPCDIISVDSALVYKGMDIGTAKPDADTLARAPHRLLDICDPSRAYSAADFRADALREMRAITDAGRVPLLVGGTGLYFRALQSGLSVLPAADAAIRSELTARADKLGWQQLHAELAEIDPAAAVRIHRNDPQRIQRALEVYRLTGKPLSELQRAGQGPALDYRVVTFIVAPAERRVLHERIERRFEQMLADGLIDEVRRLAARTDLGPDLPSMRAVGYRQVLDYLAGKTDFDTMCERAKTATRQLAKRQLTWLRSVSDANWVDSTKNNALEQILSKLAQGGIA